MIKVAVTGAAGRMGSGIIRKITEQEDMEVVAFVHGDIKDNNNREVYNADKIDILQ